MVVHFSLERDHDRRLRQSIDRYLPGTFFYDSATGYRDLFILDNRGRSR